MNSRVLVQVNSIQFLKIRECNTCRINETIKTYHLLMGQVHIPLPAYKSICFMNTANKIFKIISQIKKQIFRPLKLSQNQVHMLMNPI